MWPTLLIGQKIADSPTNLAVRHNLLINLLAEIALHTWSERDMKVQLLSTPTYVQPSIAFAV